MARAQGNGRWQLTGEKLGCLLAALDHDERRAVERYRKLQQRLTFFFMSRRSMFPEDLADEVIDRLATVLAERRSVENIEAYSLGVARLVLREEQARVRREGQIHQEVVRNSLGPAHTSNEDDAMSGAMEAQWATLPRATQEMLARYHQGRGSLRIEDRKQLAESLGISMGALRKRVFDLQATLRNRLRQRLKSGDAREHEDKRHL